MLILTKAKFQQIQTLLIQIKATMCLCWSDEKSQPERIYHVNNISNQVKIGHESDNKRIIPRAAQRAVAWSGVILKGVVRPDDSSCDVH